LHCRLTDVGRPRAPWSGGRGDDHREQFLPVSDRHGHAGETDDLLGVQPPDSLARHRIPELHRLVESAEYGQHGAPVRPPQSDQRDGGVVQPAYDVGGDKPLSPART